MNKLDAFNNDKFKCPKCKEHFDRFLTWWSSMLSVTLCKDCDEKFGHYWDGLCTKHFYVPDLKISFKEFLNEQT